ncbi:NADP-dependent alcohol dehydrogenase [Chitinophaga ginsengisegetis]|uniref:NADP-dependent alcohol dehydrogenase n=1 Tax=Chitinophaga ginsengisegetis TaxID=393003 RepID=A0A1T5N5F3_9BACT|nr:iron-containing alcohol dehydrogenase [Chitinophaga ginsengisegetis]SKC95676.1 NADP-dependent alcohol dehydrogenase [Chitinophaga ginsengisegetis]
MLNFEYFNPTKLIFGKGQIVRLAELVPAKARVLLIYGGGSIFRNGVYEQVKEALKHHEIIEFGGVEPNPHFETLMKAVMVAREQQLDFILAVGGGSVIDGAKFVSAAIKFEDDPVNLLRGQIQITDNVVPLGTVLTLPATGSEMNAGSVVTIAATQEKLFFAGPALFPQFSICDPGVVASLPPAQIQNGVVDAFTHVMEQYLTYPTSAFLQDRISEGILQTLIETGPEVVKHPGDYELAANLMWCCTMALNGLIQNGVPTDWVTHLIGHELTALYGIDHARTLAVIGPNLYRVMFTDKKEKLAQYGRRVWGLKGDDINTLAQLAIIKTIDFFHEMGVDTQLSGYTSDYAKSADIIVERFEQRGWIAIGERQHVTPDKVREIVEASY